MHFIIFALSFTYTYMPYLLQKKIELLISLLIQRIFKDPFLKMLKIKQHIK